MPVLHQPNAHLPADSLLAEGDNVIWFRVILRKLIPPSGSWHINVTEKSHTLYEFLGELPARSRHDFIFCKSSNKVYRLEVPGYNNALSKRTCDNENFSNLRNWIYVKPFTYTKKVKNAVEILILNHSGVIFFRYIFHLINQGKK